MVKQKKKNAANSEKLHARKSNQFKAPKKLNPFEVHINKEKFKVLGRENKNDKGLPGVSRSKALQKRRETIGQEFKDRNKMNRFKDNRITGLTREQEINARFTTERINQFKSKRGDMFNLNDSEVLTHKGAPIDNPNYFSEDFHSDDDMNDDDEIGRLDAEFTEMAHFGGGAQEDAGTAAMNRKAAIEDLITEHKKRKQEIGKEKEAVYAMTQKLDANWKSVLPLIGKLSNNDDEVKPKPDDYDRALREMIFEPRGAVTDRLESAEELARKEKERLEKMERERLARMYGEQKSDGKPKHRSADDLDEGYYLQDGGEPSDDEQDYKKDNNNDEDDESDESSEEEEAADDDAKEDESDDEDSDGSNDSEDNLSDLKGSDSEDDVEEPVAKIPKVSNGKGSKVKPPKQQIPFTFDLPEKYEELIELLSQHSPEDRATILERMIKCNDPKIEPDNKPKIVTLVTFLLQYINDMFTEVDDVDELADNFKLLGSMSPMLYDLIHMNPAPISNCFREIIKEKHKEFSKSSKQFPGLEVLAYLKLVSNLFSTSDFSHPVVTPSLLFISQMLTRCRVKTRRDISYGLFLVTLVLEYTAISKRFLPAAMNFLSGVIFLAIKKHPIQLIRVVPPFINGADSSVLVVGEDESKKLKEERLLPKDFVLENFDVSFKIRSLNATIKIATDMMKTLGDNVGVPYFVEPLIKMLEKLDTSIYPKHFQTNCGELQTLLTRLEAKTMVYLVPPARKPKALRLLEPKIVKIYDDKRKLKPMSKQKAVVESLKHRIKREEKGAIREIRRDNALLSKMQLKKQMQSDAVRRDKVKQIYSEASLQQGELNAMDRKKKHKK